MSLELFHPVIQQWFRGRFAAPTEPQELGWPDLVAGRDVLIAAPTGSGKTLTAFLAAIDRLLRLAVRNELTDEIRVVYVSPLRALSNDMHRNLEVPLAEILAVAGDLGLEIPPIRVGLRTGDTSASQRAAIVRRPPQILVTTPESLYLMLTSPKAREKLKTVETVIVDEIHALVRDKRGSHLALTLERLAALCPQRLQRIGLSATQRPIEEIARFLVGAGEVEGRGLRVEEQTTVDSHRVVTPIPSPPSSGERVRVRGPSGEPTLFPEFFERSLSFDEQSSAIDTQPLSEGPPHPNPLPPKAGGEGTRPTPPSSALPSTLNPQPSTPPLPVIIDVGFQRQLDLGIEVPPSELGAVCMHEQWAEINARIVELVNGHRATLIFVNTRRLAERLTHQLSELLGEEAITSHHGSLAADLRHDTEQRLKSGQLKAVVATASLEMGLDIGYIDLVIQIGSSRNIATFLQRVGRSGHALGLVPKGRMFALTRDELIECMAITRAIRHGRLDIVPIPVAPLDVLAQQIVAAVACEDWSSDELFAVCRRAAPYRNLPRADFDRIVQMLSEGITNSAGRSRVYLHHDQVGRRLRARPGARIAAISNAGAIPEVFAIRVVTEEDHTVVGSVDEDFGTESQAGEIFLLGNTSWRIRYLRGGDLFVTDAHGAPPTIPFWRGEAPGRTFELSEEVSLLREELERRLAYESEPSENRGATDSASSKEVGWDQRCVAAPAHHEDATPLDGGPALEASLSHPTSTTVTAQDQHDSLPVEDWLAVETHVSIDAARQTVEYARAQKAAIGLLPTMRRVVFERFFDESGGMQLVIHAPFGMRITRAWGLAMRKRFCRSFDFELQASADDDGIVLSLGPQHSFPLESMFGMLTPRNVQEMFEQAVLAVPIFQNRWRWNATRALQVIRSKHGQRVPPALQRFRSEDLLTAVFPKLTGCQENVVGDIELPDHPLVRQTMDDCLHEAHDIAALKEVLGRVERGEIEFLARDTREPSPFSYELLNANPYAFLDGGEVAERRARAVATRRSLSVESLQDLGRLDPEAIRQVVAEAQPLVRNADELHDALLSRVLLPVEEGLEWCEFFDELVAAGRATTVLRSGEPADCLVPSPPSSGERARVRGPSGEQAPNSEQCLLADHQPSTINSQPALESPPHPNPLPPKAGGEGTGVLAWAATERVPIALAAFPDATLTPVVTVPPEVRHDWGSIEARVTMLRGLLEICGPITAETAAERLEFTVSQTDAALEALEGEGVVLRGRFSEGVSDEWRVASNEEHFDPAASDPQPSTFNPQPSTEWCHRRLLARIHRLTLDGLRKQIEPVTVDVFIRFLARHHGLLPGTQRAGTNGLFEVISQLQGLDIPAVAWERDLLPARLDGYEPAWLDELCLTGEVGWGRMFPPVRNPDRAKPMASLTRVAPVSIFLRQDVEWLTDRAPQPDAEGLSSPAVEVCELLQARGAVFASDILAATRMLPSHLDDVLGELVTRGWLTADGFAGLRTLIADKKPHGRAASRHRAERTRTTRMALGRWSLRSEEAAKGRQGHKGPKLEEGALASQGIGIDSADVDRTCIDGTNTFSPSRPFCPSTSTTLTALQTTPDPRDHAKRIAEDWAWQLLRRWGVVFRDLLTREFGTPSWFELLQVLRRLEARGEIRGGRFITGVAGEQFALPDTIRQLRQLRDEVPPQEVLVISAADPLNLVGILTKHDRIPSTASNRVAYLDGHPVASLQAEEVRWLAAPPGHLKAVIEQSLLGRGSRAEHFEPVASG
ncbi:MAG: DEAD/DEAH box helicase [Planctomycetota bacterium]